MTPLWAANAAAAAGAEGAAELIRAASAGAINLAILSDRTADPPWKKIEHSTKPTIVLIGDDDYHATGPCGWHAADRLIGWARSALVHAAAACSDDYLFAIGLSRLFHRLVLVETDTAHAPGWIEALAVRNVPLVLVQPAAGLPHPITPPRNSMQ